MIELHQFPRALGLPNMSPFCMKVETYLRLTRTPYQHVDLFDPRKAPKGKGPYIVDGGETISDSNFILDHLKKKYGDPLGEGLSAQERARHHALARMLEEHTYFIVVADRWLEPENAARVRELWFGKVPAPFRGLVFAMVQRDIRRTVWGHGIYRHSLDERMQLLAKDLQALTDTLGDAPFFGGDTPREIDAVAFSFIATMLTNAFPGRLRDLAASYAGLVDYNARTGHKVFPDFFAAEQAAAS